RLVAHSLRRLRLLGTKPRHYVLSTRPSGLRVLSARPKRPDVIESGLPRASTVAFWREGHVMNGKSLAIAAVVAWIVDSVYGFLVFGLALNSEFLRYPAVFRPFEAVQANLPLMFG